MDCELFDSHLPIVKDILFRYIKHKINKRKFMFYELLSIFHKNNPEDYKRIIELIFIEIDQNICPFFHYYDQILWSITESHQTELGNVMG
jgi:hypothetical protein